MVNQVRKAFTLIEILIVVIILGILAAIVVPQFTSATEEAQISNMQSTLQTIRNQIELYRVRNNGQYPDFLGVLAGGWGDPNAALPVDQGLRGTDYLRGARQLGLADHPGCGSDSRRHGRIPLGRPCPRCRRRRDVRRPV